MPHTSGSGVARLGPNLTRSDESHTLPPKAAPDDKCYVCIPENLLLLVERDFLIEVLFLFDRSRCFYSSLLLHHYHPALSYGCIQ